MGFLHTRITNPRPTGCSYGWFPSGLHLNGHQSVDVDFDPFTTIPLNSGYLPMLIQQLRQGLVKFEYWVEAPCTCIQNPRTRTAAPPVKKPVIINALEVPIGEKKSTPIVKTPPVQAEVPFSAAPTPLVAVVPREPIKESIHETPVVSAPPFTKAAKEAPVASEATVKEETAIEEKKVEIPEEFSGLSRRSRRRR